MTARTRYYLFYQFFKLSGEEKIRNIKVFVEI